MILLLLAFLCSMLAGLRDSDPIPPPILGMIVVGTMFEVPTELLGTLAKDDWMAYFKMMLAYFTT